MENDFYFSKKKRNDAYIWYFLIKFVRMKKIYLDSDRCIVAYIFMAFNFNRCTWWKSQTLIRIVKKIRKRDSHHAESFEGNRDVT